MREANETVLFEAPAFRVRHVAVGDSAQCIVTFHSLTQIQSLDRPGFGEDFLRQQGIDAIHVINRDNAWYHYPELPEALACIAKCTAGYQWVATSGSSMGGYAAIRFAEALGASTAIAISPQYSVSCRLVPFETRWRLPVEYRRGGLEIDASHGSARVKVVVFYDPLDLDRCHFEMISRHYSHTVGVPMPHAGHPAGAMLHETGMLKNSMSEIADGVFDADVARKTLRARRRMSGQYLFTLARRLGPAHMMLKQKLAHAAAEASHSAAYLIYEALVCEVQGKIRDSRERFEEALTMMPDNDAPLRALTGFCMRHGQLAEAVAFARRLCVVAPQPHYQRLLVMALAANGELPQARDISRGISGFWWGDALLMPGIAGLFASRVIKWWYAHPKHRTADFLRVDEWHARRKKGRLCPHT